MTSAALDMSLDDLIKTNKQPVQGKARGSRGRNGASRAKSNTSPGGPIRGNASRSASRPSPYTLSKPASRAPDGQWTHDLFEEDAGVVPLKPNTGIETGTKLFISNLDFAVSDEDIKELFSEIGDLKRSTIHYDRSGRSKGTAEIVYSRRIDAVTAKKRYNNVQLDGKPMKIEIIGTNLPTPVAPSKITNGPSVRKGGKVSRETASRGRGGFLKNNRGRGHGRGTVKSAEELDAELEGYHAEAMQVS